MKMNDVFPSKYLKASDIEGEMTVTVKNCVPVMLTNRAGEDEQKPLITFEGVEKGVILNITNWKAIEKQHGHDSDDWKGKQITLIKAYVDAFGETVEAIRIKPGSGSKPTGAQPEPKNLDKTSDFWAKLYGMGLSAEDGKRILEENDGDFAAALAALVSSDEDKLPF